LSSCSQNNVAGFTKLKSQNSKEHLYSWPAIPTENTRTDVAATKPGHEASTFLSKVIQRLSNKTEIRAPENTNQTNVFN
jgi:hypothetical protein